MPETESRRPAALLLGLATLLPFVAVAGFAVLTAFGVHRAADETRLRHTVRALATAVDAELGRYVTALETLAMSRLLDDPLDVETLEERARIIGERLGGWIVLVGPSPGHQMLANTRRQPGTPLPSGVPVQEQVALMPTYARIFIECSPGISNLFPGTVAGRPPYWRTWCPSIGLYKPRRALALALEPTALRALLARQDLPPGMFAAIADRQSGVLAHSFDPGGRRVGVPATAAKTTAAAGMDVPIV